MHETAYGGYALL